MGKHYFKCLACGREEQQYIGAQYFQIPENIERKAKWLHCLNKLNLLNQQISRDLRVCERHFSVDMYAKSKRRLKQSAIPVLDILKPVTINEDIQMKDNLSCVPPVAPGEAGIDGIKFDESFNAPVKIEEPDEPLSNEIEAVGGFDTLVENYSTEEQKLPQTSFTKKEEVLDFKLECENIKEEIKYFETETIEDFDVPVEKSTKEDKSTQTSFTESEEIYNLKKECESLKRELENLKKEKFSKK